MKLIVGEKLYNIKFGYKPTLKERVISKIVKLADINDENGDVDFEKIEDLLLYLPEILLVGLQVHHEEYRYDYDTKEGKQEQLDKVFDIIEEYSSQENADLTQLFNDLQMEMKTDSFLAKMFQAEQKKASKGKKTTKQSES